MKKISNKDFLQPLKNRPELEPRLEFKDHLLLELQTIKPKKQRFKAMQIAFLTGIVVVLSLIVFSNNIDQGLKTHESRSLAIGVKRDQKVLDKGNTNNRLARGQKIVYTVSSVKLYESVNYHVSLQYPKDWKLNNFYSDRYEGTDGFFQVIAFDGKGWAIDEVATKEANHVLKPYGSKPAVSSLTIQGQEAIFIMPSDDQSGEYHHQAAIIMKYPNPIVIGGQTYHYFILYADQNHINDIANTIKFK